MCRSSILQRRRLSRMYAAAFIQPLPSHPDRECKGNSRGRARALVEPGAGKPPASRNCNLVELLEGPQKLPPPAQGTGYSGAQGLQTRMQKAFASFPALSWLHCNIVGVFRGSKCLSNAVRPGFKLQARLPSRFAGLPAQDGIEGTDLRADYHQRSRNRHRHLERCSQACPSC